MYARFIFSVGFKRMVWASLFFCFCVGYFLRPTLACADQYITIDGKRYLVGVFTTTCQNGGTKSDGSSWFVPTPYYVFDYASGSRILRHCGQMASGQALYVRANILSTTIIIDSDSDGMEDVKDPCPNSTDSNFTAYRTKNRCTGSYYFFQITGECGQTRTFFNPQYATIQDAYNAANSAPPECFDALRDSDRVSISAEDLKNWFESSSLIGATGGTLPGVNPSVPDPTGGNNTSPTSTPKPVDTSDPDNQKIIDQIERMKVGIEQAVMDSSENVRNQIEITGNSLGTLLKGLGGSDHGVSSAIGSASGTAHADAQALGAKLDLLTSKIGTPANATYGGLSKTEMDQALELDRQETYKVETGVFDSIETSQTTLFEKITSRSLELKSKVQSLIPSFDVQTENINSCVPATVVSMHGSSITMPEICLTPFEAYFVMLGNVLYGAACIGSILTIFGFRG